MRTGEACTSRKPKPGLGTLVNVNVALDHPAGLGVATVYNSSSVPLTERIPERSRHLCSGGGTAFSKTVTDEQERGFRLHKFQPERRSVAFWLIDTLMLYNVVLCWLLR